MNSQDMRLVTAQMRHPRRDTLQKMNFGKLLVITLMALILMAVSYVAGVAAASNGSANSGYMSVLSQLKAAQSDDLVSRALRLLKAKYYMPIDAEQQQKLLYGAVQGMLATLRVEPFKDEFSHFYDPELYADLEAQTSGEYAGIGILMGLTDDGMYPEVVTVFPDTPAAEQQLQPDDIIAEVAGQDAFGMILPQVATLIKGEPGTKVTLKVFRPADGDFTDFEIERREVQYSSVAKKELLEGGIGYIEITNFAEDTGKDFRAALEQLSQQGMKTLVIDLRNNTGGLLDAAVAVADCFVKEGPIVEVAYREEQPTILHADPNSQKYSLPLVIMINSNSASASEVLTGALKDYKLCKVVGEKSFGKGVVQEVIPMETQIVELKRGDGQTVREERAKSALAVTIAKYYTPLHNDIHGVGIEPNVWYDVNNQIAEDAQLQAMQNQLDTKLEELRRLRAQINSYLRKKDNEKNKALGIARKLAAGVEIADVPKLEPDTPEHTPLGAVPPHIDPVPPAVPPATPKDN